MSEVLSVKEKIGYGMGDAASHIIFDNVMLYMMFFYTDIFGIPAGFVGTMFLLAPCARCYLRSVHGPDCRPYPQPLGQVPAVDIVRRHPVWHRLRAGVHHAGFQP